MNDVSDSPTNGSISTFHEQRKNYLLSLTLVPIFTVLMCVAARISIPVSIIPITFQITVAIMSGLLLGGRLGFLSQALYLFMGLMGLPVFTSGGGLGYIFLGSFGYLIGFVFCALLGGFLADRLDRHTDKIHAPYLWILIISLISLLLCYAVGVCYTYFLTIFYTGYAGNKYAFLATLSFTMIPYIIKDTLLCFLAAELTRRLWRFRYRGRRAQKTD
jgi:biotin transport system substrate-specific component